MGWTVLRRPTLHAPSRDVLVSAWIGWYVQGMAVLAAGWLGLLSPVWLSLLLLVPLAGAFLDRRRFGSWLGAALRDYRRTLRAPGWAWLLAGTVCLWVLLQLSAPPFQCFLAARRQCLLLGRVRSPKCPCPSRRLWWPISF